LKKKTRAGLWMKSIAYYNRSPFLAKQASGNAIDRENCDTKQDVFGMVDAAKNNESPSIPITGLERHVERDAFSQFREPCAPGIIPFA
jgi:hypothetical protein